MWLNRCIYFTLLALSVLSAVFLSGQIGSLPLYFLIALGLVSILYTFIVSATFAYMETKKRETYIRGVRAEHTLELYNEGILVFPHVSAEVYKGGELIRENFSIMPHDRAAVQTMLQFDHIGKYAVGFTKAVFYDPLGLIRMTYRNENKDILVRPRIVEIGGLNLLSGNTPKRDLVYISRRTEENDDYSGVRDYAQGDSLKSIHWKLSAHLLKYMSRRYETSVDRGISIYIDMHTPACPREDLLSLYDCVIESALAIAYFGLKNNFSTELVYCTDRSIYRLRLDHPDEVEQISDGFSLMKFGGCFRVEELIRSDIKDQASFENIFICSASLSYDLADFLASLKASNKNPALVFAVPGNYAAPTYQNIFDFLKEMDVEYHVAASSEDLVNDMRAR
jgi:uncharacterized protein (DUF58 family)